jgi:putative peptidoglycan lipid II flippase
VALLMQYGKFDAHSTQLISWALLWYAAGLVGHCVVEILARSFYALRDTKTPVLVGVVAMGLNVLFSVLFSAMFDQLGWMPHGGLALANSLATALEMVGLLVLIRRRLSGLEGRSVLVLTAQAAGASIMMVLALWGWLALTTGRPAWMAAVGGVILGGGVYSLAVLATGVKEARQMARWLVRKTGSHTAEKWDC